MQYRSGILLTTSFVALALGCAPQAVAQVPGSAQSGAAGSRTEPAAGGAQAQPEFASGIDDIVVTARRREEALQDVPVAVTAATGVQLERRGVTEFMDLNRSAPSLSIAPSTRGSNVPNVAIRGQRQIDTGINTDPAVVIYVNELPYTRPNGLNGSLFDIQSVQVLRGPQGTLFGRNTTGGAMLITTARPSDEFQGRFVGSVGNFDYRDAEGMFNAPLAEGVAIRFAGKLTRRDGYMHDRATGREANDVKNDGERVTLRIAPGDRFSTDLMYERFHGTNNGTLNQIFGAAGTFAGALASEIETNRARPYTFVNNTPGREVTKANTYASTSTFRISDDVSLKNVMGWRNVSTLSDQDFDGSSLFLLANLGLTNMKQFSDEVQLAGKYDQLEWIIGLFYFNERGSDVSNLRQVGSTSVVRRSGIIDVRNRSYSGFASVTYNFPQIEGLSLTGGLRYTKDKREATALQTANDACNLLLADGSRICTLPTDTSYAKPSWTVSANYQIAPGKLVYVAHRRGYRAGGLQNRVSRIQEAVPFNPEGVNDVEIGTKLDFDFGFPVRLNLAAYRAWYTDLQRSQSLTLPGTTTLVSLIANAAKGRTQGVEVETVIKPVSGLTLSGAFAVVDTKYDEFLFRGIDVSDQMFSYVPKYTADAAVAYELPLAAEIGKIILNANVHRQTGMQVTDVPKPFMSLPGYTLVNARLDWSNVMGSSFGAALFVNNLTDRVHFTSGTSITDSLGTASRVVGPPRMYGLQLRYEF